MKNRIKVEQISICLEEGKWSPVAKCITSKDNKY